MLIIEGSDCLGKTTAINSMRKMVKDWNPPILYSHMSRPNEDKFDFCQQYKTNIRPFVIQDRFHLGALVWHKGKMDCGKLWSVEKCIEKVGGLVVIFYTSDYDWYRTQLTKDQRGNMFSIAAMMDANTVYRQMVCGYAYPQPRVDGAVDVQNGKFPTDDALYDIIKDWKERLEMTQWKNEFTTD